MPTPAPNPPPSSAASVRTGAATQPPAHGRNSAGSSAQPDLAKSAAGISSIPSARHVPPSATVTTTSVGSVPGSVGPNRGSTTGTDATTSTATVSSSRRGTGDSAASSHRPIPSGRAPVGSPNTSAPTTAASSSTTATVQLTATSPPPDGPFGPPSASRPIAASA